MNLSLRTAARIAWRETRSSLVKFLFVVLAVAAGVGALSGVRGFSESFHGMLTAEARTVMAGDLARAAVRNAVDAADCGARRAGGARRGLYLGHGNGFHGCVEIERRHPGAGGAESGRSFQVSLLRRDEIESANVAGGGADAGYRGRGRRPADAAEREGRRFGAGGRKRFARRWNHRTGARPHVGEPEHRAAVDDVPRGLRVDGLDANRQPRRGAIPVQAGAECSACRRSPAVDSQSAAGGDGYRLPAIASHHHGRSGPSHDVSEPDQPHRADCGRDRRGHGHARAPATEDGSHRRDEIAGRDIERNHPDLYHSDADAGGDGRARGGCGGAGRRRSFSAADQEILFPERGDGLARDGRSAGNRNRRVDHFTVHVAAAAWRFARFVPR